MLAHCNHQQCLFAIFLLFSAYEVMILWWERNYY